MEIDEAAATKQPVKRLTPCRMPRAQPLERGGLIRAEVLHLDTGIVLHARDDKVDEGLARSLLVGPFHRPALLEASDAVPVACQKAGQVFQAVLADERIALEIEEHVAAR